ncbi:hypothetical protein OCU04_012774 [Sclerotinia nivalis]|uniref:Uncharacterized protein n=1 Tax=Sclerotinia nivalis TaxID=352851 RepID=A0A9X0A9E5_9HELO|nr:hypothetical protein OCU04_012774 [Sclerotinia nivalis]
MECDRSARSISGASAGRPVDIPGSLSYAIVCTGCQEQQQDLIVSFQDSEAKLDNIRTRIPTPHAPQPEIPAGSHARRYATVEYNAMVLARPWHPIMHLLHPCPMNC